MTPDRARLAPLVARRHGLGLRLVGDVGCRRRARPSSASRTRSRSSRPTAPRKDDRVRRAAAGRGIRVIIAGAGGAAHLPGMLASVTTLPVIGVPVPLAKLDGLDSLLSIVQMPAGIPVATVSIGGARNAGLLAARILADRRSGARRPARRVRRVGLEAARRREEREAAARSGERVDSPVRHPDTRSPQLMTQAGLVARRPQPADPRLGAGARRQPSARPLRARRRPSVLWVAACSTAVVLLSVARARVLLAIAHRHSIVLWRRSCSGCAVLRRPLGRPRRSTPCGWCGSCASPRRRAAFVGRALDRGARASVSRHRRLRGASPRTAAIGAARHRVRRRPDRAARSTAGTTSCCSAATPAPTGWACAPTASRWSSVDAETGADRHDRHPAQPRAGAVRRGLADATGRSRTGYDCGDDCLIDYLYTYGEQHPELYPDAEAARQRARRRGDARRRRGRDSGSRCSTTC